MIKVRHLSMIYEDLHSTPALEDINLDIEKMNLSLSWARAVRENRL